jgi:hypothetical protein
MTHFLKHTNCFNHHHCHVKVNVDFVFEISYERIEQQNFYVPKNVQSVENFPFLVEIATVLIFPFVVTANWQQGVIRCVGKHGRRRYGVLYKISFAKPERFHTY